MKQFCTDVLKFLESEYSDAYRFEIEYHAELRHQDDTIELTVALSPNLKRKLSHDIMFYIFGWYLTGEFVEERNQYRWQKELIDMIEGG
jgi:hypothetical protein